MTLPFKLSELKHEKWCITSNFFDDKTYYLAWQEVAWDEDGYFWTSRDIVESIIKNNTPEHPFLFNSRRTAIKHLKSIDIPQKCRIVRW